VSDPTIRVDVQAVEAREVDGELVIYDLRDRRYLGGNATAAALWPLLVEGTSREALTERLQTAYGVDPERARSDVDAFVSALGSLGMLASAGSTGSTG
jgi:hypothetical protein